MDIGKLIFVIVMVVFLIWYMIAGLQLYIEEKQKAKDRKARTKHIKREYDGLTVDITIVPISFYHGDDEYWSCEYKCEFFHGDFSFKDFPSIEQQMEAKILPLAQSVGRWKYRLKEIEEIS